MSESKRLRLIDLSYIKEKHSLIKEQYQKSLLEKDLLSGNILSGQLEALYFVMELLSSPDSTRELLSEVYNKGMKDGVKFISTDYNNQEREDYIDNLIK